MTKELAGRVAIVTGAGRNIGRGIALALADGGAAVVVNARSNLQEAEAVAGEIERAGGKALAVTADVADADAVRTMATAAAGKFGRIDILVNNAAVRVEQAFEEMTLAQWRAVTSIILDGAFNCVQACLPHLKRSGSRRDRQYRRPFRAYRRGRPGACGDRQGRHCRLHPRAGARARRRQDQGQHGDARHHGGAAAGGPAGAAASRARAGAGRPPRSSRTTSPPRCASSAARARASSPGRISRSTAGCFWGELLGCHARASGHPESPLR